MLTPDQRKDLEAKVRQCGGDLQACQRKAEQIRGAIQAFGLLLAEDDEAKKGEARKVAVPKKKAKA